ncbi:hypothetical protein ABEB36_014744 [Hypothenemus hampei]|uniref:HEAT repeat-containing protein 1 n=1 Tax=Hypothenemus hampei TaxID=57062 RepID=A0ABD1E2Q5_HYPHA
MEKSASVANTRGEENFKNKEKIKKVLRKFLDQDFKLKNEVYLNKFLTFLFNGDSCSISSDSVPNERDEHFCQWLIDASILWDKKQVTPSKVILTFALNLAGHLSAKEQLFVKLNYHNVYESLTGISQLDYFKNDANVMLGFCTLLCTFLEHKNGLQWILTTVHWRKVIWLARNAHTMYIRKKAYEFVSKLLNKTVCFNQHFCENLVKMLIDPIENVLNKLQLDTDQPAPIKNQELFDSVKPDLSLISEVMEIVIKNLQPHIIDMFIKFGLNETIEKLLLLSQLEEFSFELIKIRCIILFSKLEMENENLKRRSMPQLAQDSFAFFDIKTLFDLISSEMERDHVRCIIKTSHYAHALYSSLASKFPLCFRKGEPIEFQNQMVLFQLLPVMIFFSNTVSSREAILNDVFRREFVRKLVKMSAIRTLDICLRWKLRLKDKPDLIEDMTFGLQYLLKSKNLLTKQEAAMFFQPLVYSLKDTLTLLKEKNGNIDVISGCNRFLHTLVQAIIDLVQSFDFTWRDTIETISIMNFVCEILQYNMWDQRLSVSLLKLLNLALSKCMSPDMVLLMDNTKDSIVSQTGSILYTYSHNSSWEIRDSALECVYTLSSNANSKFPSHTNILIESAMPQLVIDMALNDGEFYVRASAFKCLQEMVQIQEIWETFLNQHNQFLKNLLNVFENETEGVVRKEATTLIHKIDKFQSWPSELTSRVYDVMTHATLADLYWEVKCNALDFWIHTINIHLSNQGMIDNTFPEITFSKEHRKIVTLNEVEVRKRLIKVLNQLSQIGCLYVLKCACLDECDMEVSKKSSSATKMLVDLLKNYN